MTFQAIKIGSTLEVMAAGGTVDILQRTVTGWGDDRKVREHYIGLAPHAARELAAALLKAAAASDGLPSGFDQPEPPKTTA